MANDVKSLAHTKWNCKYHIVFAPKYRRKVFFGEKKKEIGAILRKLCEWKGGEHSRSRNMSRSCTYVGGDTTENVSIRIYGIPKREE